MSVPLKVLLIFIDGIGLGLDDPAQNPFAASTTTLSSGIRLVNAKIAQSRSAILVPTDACLGIPGAPQSATGQTALLTGINAAALLGHHLSAYPNRRLAQLLAEKSIFAWCREHGFSATFANGYRAEYWAAIENGKLRHSATTLAVLGSQGTLRTEQDYAEGKAVYHDITGQFLHSLGKTIPLLTPQEAGTRVACLALEHDFTLFEYFLTDMAGHHRQWKTALLLLEQLETFIQSILHQLDLTRTAVVVASDHGNFEDFSVRGHTRNPVPTLLYGPVAARLAPAIHSLTDIIPALENLLLPSASDQAW